LRLLAPLRRQQPYSPRQRADVHWPLESSGVAGPSHPHDHRAQEGQALRVNTSQHLQQLSLIPGLEPESPATFDPLQDGERLRTQLERVADVVADGHPRCLPQIAGELRKRFPDSHFPEASISARLRDLHHRGWSVTRFRAERNSGLWFYRASKEGQAC
jgi:hypothetical protein